MREEALFQQDFWILLVSKVSEKMIWISHPKSDIDLVSILLASGFGFHMTIMGQPC